MKKLLLTVLTIFTLAGCAGQNAAPEPAPAGSAKHGCDAFEECDMASYIDTEDAKVFKEIYEALNGTMTKSGKVRRTVTIPEDNPYQLITPEEAVQKTKDGETFWLYVGDPKCPWCRSAVETATEKAKEYGIELIYYFNIWDTEGNEVLRDKYELKDNVPELVQEGTPAYHEMLELFDAVLDDYTIKTEEKTEVSVGEKRIYAPNFFYIKDGTAVKMIKGYSELQEDSYGLLTEEMLADERAQFDSFFQN